MGSHYWHRGELPPPIAPLANACKACRRLPSAHQWPICCCVSSSWGRCADCVQGLCGHWACLGRCCRSCSWRCCPALTCACITVPITLAAVSSGSCIQAIQCTESHAPHCHAGEAACCQPDKRRLITGNKSASDCMNNQSAPEVQQQAGQGVSLTCPGGSGGCLRNGLQAVGRQQHHVSDVDGAVAHLEAAQDVGGVVHVQPAHHHLHQAPVRQ